MLRRCDGTDPYLIRNDPPWRPDLPPTEQHLGPARPCDCRAVFDDARHLVIFPHPPIAATSFVGGALRNDTFIPATTVTIRGRVLARPTGARRLGWALRWRSRR